MSDEERAFRDRLAAEPGDETARLVFADWLDEQGKGEEAIPHRALVANGWYPNVFGRARGVAQDCDCFLYDASGPYMRLSDRPLCAKLPPDLFALVSECADSHSLGGTRKGCCGFYDAGAESRAVEAILKAFTKLPPARRTELFTTEVSA